MIARVGESKELHESSAAVRANKPPAIQKTLSRLFFSHGRSLECLTPGVLAGVKKLDYAFFRKKCQVLCLGADTLGKLTFWRKIRLVFANWR
jgi:hypothetical protein